MIEPIVCAECEQPIEGDVVWWSPFGSDDNDPDSALAFAGSAERTSEHQLPFHRACFKDAIND